MLRDHHVLEFQMFKWFALGCLTVLLLPAQATTMQVLRVPHIADAAPFIILNDQQQPVAGMLYELYDRLSAGLGLSMHIAPVPRKLVGQLLLNGDIDIYCNATPEWFTEPAFRWSPPLFIHRDVVVSRRNYADFASFLKQARGRIGTTNEYIYPTLQRLFQQGQLQRVDSFSPRESLASLQKHHLDAVVVSELELKYFLHQTDDLAVLVIAQNQIQCIYSPALSEAQVQQLNTQLTLLIKQGELIKIVDKYQ